MDRRRFIVFGAAGGIAVLTGCGGGAGGAGMPATGTAPPPVNPPVNPPVANPPPATPPVSPLTVGQPLADLVRLANTSATPGVFAATLTA